MKIFYLPNGKCYGEVGTETDLVDSVGNALFVGDIVLVKYLKGDWGRLSIVFQYECDGEFYIPDIPHVVKSNAEGFYCEKVIDFSKLSKGFTLRKFEYM